MTHTTGFLFGYDSSWPRVLFGSIPISTKNPGAHFLGNLRKNLGSFENVAPGAMDWIAMPYAAYRYTIQAILLRRCQSLLARIHTEETNRLKSILNKTIGLRLSYLPHDFSHWMNYYGFCRSCYVASNRSQSSPCTSSSTPRSKRTYNLGYVNLHMD